MKLNASINQVLIYQKVTTDYLIMPSRMEVASQHCDTVPNKTKDILYTVDIEKIFIHDSRVQHPVQSSVRGTLRVPQT